jgi:predicted ABC-type ATPase
MEGIAVRIWYVGLTNAELHIARVQARVKRGGHDTPEEKLVSDTHRAFSI